MPPCKPHNPSIKWQRLSAVRFELFVIALCAEVSMKAWRLNEYDWYAAETFEDAVKEAIKLTGDVREDIVDDMYVTEEPEHDSTEIWADEERTRKITVAQAISEMDGPGYCFGSES